MWCKNCNRETDEEVCSVCGIKTEEDIPYELHWCDECKVPLIKAINDADRDTCSLCGGKTSYLVADLRPVFPEERLLLEILSDKPLAYINKSVWASNNRYYIDGKPIVVTAAWYKKYSAAYIREQLEKYKEHNNYNFFNENIATFIRANQGRLDYLKYEANIFIQESAAKFPRENIVLSFSGGKDSTVTADLVVKALSDPSLVHIFGNTTLEFPCTIEYAERFKKNNPKAIFKVAKNKEQNFYEVCEDIGPPARMLRWCCFMFKTGPISRVITGLYRDKSILTYYGIRKCESVSRSKYNRIEDNAESTKIQQQTSVITVTNRKYAKEKKAMANYEIVKKIAVLGGKPDGVTKEINIVKWGVYDPAIDIRRWQGDIASKGISLKREEAQKLLEALKIVFGEAEA